MNVWNKANWKTTTIEKDGIFYELPKINKAYRITDTVPGTVIAGLKDKFKVLEDGTFQITTDWGEAKCAPNNGYVIIYGIKENGELDANFLTKGTPSFEQYYVCDENGNIIESLQEYDKSLEPKI